MSLSRQSSAFRFLARASPNKKKKDLEQLLQTSPSFPGIPLHVSTPEDVTREEIDEVEVSFPVHIRNTKILKEQPKKAKPVLPDEELDYLFTVRVGSALDQGKRDYMEDRVSIVENLCEQENDSVGYFAIFDGHAGARAAQICCDTLHEDIKRHEAFPEGDMECILRETLLEKDKCIIEKGIEEDWTEGSCVSIATIRDKVLTTANLGDSHMIVALRDALNGSVKASRISETHKATEETEKQRITSAGGMVMRGRVFGDLSISRALGDRNYKVPKQEENYVSAEAFTISTKLTHHHLFAIIASDGLWDKVEFQEAIDFVQEKIKETEPDEIASSLLKLTQERGSVDNISIIIIKLDWTRKPAPEDE